MKNMVWLLRKGGAMITYPAVHEAVFIERPNRFIAQCRLIKTNELVTVHVKNTGRCKELLVPNALVALSYQPSPKRKTAYDLIAVKKNAAWINIDSQVPNALAKQGIQEGKIRLPELTGAICRIKPEQSYGQSKFDLLVETSTGQQAFVELKGMTLENKRIGAFPDAPSLRALKHIKELITATQAGYYSYVIFIIQFEAVTTATVHTEMQPALAEALMHAQQAGVHILAYNCFVTASTIALKEPIVFKATQVFDDPNQER